MLPVRLVPVTAPQTVTGAGHGWQWVPVRGRSIKVVAFMVIVISLVDLMMERVKPTVIPGVAQLVTILVFNLILRQTI